MFERAQQRSPGRKFMLAVLAALALSIPLFMTWLLVYDRQSQSEEARSSIASGWGGPQTLDGPVLVIPYRGSASETVVENGRSVTRSRDVDRELTLAPDVLTLDTSLKPDRLKRSIYEAVVYDAVNKGQARFALPQDLSRFGVDPSTIDLSRAELRFGLSDPRGLGANPRLMVNGRPLRPQPGGGSSSGTGFFAFVDAGSLVRQPITVDFAFDFRGNAQLDLRPQAGDTRWTLRSAWPHPSFTGDFLPTERKVGTDGFTATYRVGNLALGRALASTAAVGATQPQAATTVEVSPYGRVANASSGGQIAQIRLIQPVDLYSQVNRAAKYGFLFIASPSSRF